MMKAAAGNAIHRTGFSCCIVWMIWIGIWYSVILMGKCGRWCFSNLSDGHSKAITINEGGVKNLP